MLENKYQETSTGIHLLFAISNGIYSEDDIIIHRHKHYKKT